MKYIDTNNEILMYALENGIIDLKQMQDQIAMKKRKELLNQHPYKIWQGKNGGWYTYFPDNCSKSGRKQKRRETLEKLEEDIIKYWKDLDEDPTVYELFKEWLDGKFVRGDIEPATKDRYKRQFDQCFKEIRNQKIRKISEYDIEEFMLNAIHDYNLTVKGFSNMRTLVYGIFRIAKKKKIINFSITDVVKDIEIPKKNLRHVNKNDEDQIFTEDELPILLEYLINNQDLINLGILLVFKSGLRIGELTGLEKNDIEGNIIHVRRTEVKYEKNGHMVYEVRDFPKTEAGIRDVIVPEHCLWILKKIRNISPFGQYVFEKNGKRIRSYVFNNRLRTICKHVGIVPKSPHKIRKTYGTILLDSGIEESLILSQMGHKNIQTTKGHYYYNRKSIDGKKASINNVIGL